MTSAPSPRARVALAIEAHVRAHRDVWDGPIEVELRKLQRGGGVRIIRFGQRPHSQVEAWVWGERRVEMTGRGPLAAALRGFHASFDEVIRELERVEALGTDADSFPGPLGEEYDVDEDEAAYQDYLAAHEDSSLD